MTSLPVYFEQRLVGTIDVDKSGPCFTYDPGWLGLRGALSRQRWTRCPGRNTGRARRRDRPGFEKCFEILRVILAFREIPAIDGRFVKNLAVRQLLADRTDVLTHHFIRRGHGVLEDGVEARREVLEVVAVQLEAEALCLLGHPVKSFVGEAVRRVAAADMDQSLSQREMRSSLSAHPIHWRVGHGRRPGRAWIPWPVTQQEQVPVSRHRVKSEYPQRLPCARS
jgi:hypothetical protein